MHHLRRIIVLLSLLLVAGSAVAGRFVELVNPGPIAVPAGLSDAQVAKEIKRALMGRGWAVAQEQPGHIESTLNLREHVARIDITYDTHQVTVAYADSRNLDYEMKKGKPYIHRNYLSWVNNITTDMASNMQLTAMENTPQQGG
jgi:hypothetical protein